MGLHIGIVTFTVNLHIQLQVNIYTLCPNSFTLLSYLQYHTFPKKVGHGTLCSPMGKHQVLVRNQRKAYTTAFIVFSSSGRKGQGKQLNLSYLE
jgi:hypothetical protein